MVFKDPILLNIILSYLNASSCISLIISYKNLNNVKKTRKIIRKNVFNILKRV